MNWYKIINYMSHDTICSSRDTHILVYSVQVCCNAAGLYISNIPFFAIMCDY